MLTLNSNDILNKILEANMAINSIIYYESAFVYGRKMIILR